jgi:UDP-N-acetylglucosamine--N-acetylmuramyl-(pentapeptide) pyrophosphoryl-undecaprenol N-acetylglucosamine transferase
VPVLIHQQDVRPSLANSLCSPIASKITVSFEESAKNFFQGLGVLEHRSPQKVFFTGNPYRKSVLEGTKEEAIKFFKLETNLPTMLVLGGGTGAKFINNLFAGHLKEFLKTVQIIHITGRGKMQEAHLPNYHPYEFMDRMDLAYAAADIVISRAGLSTITELSILGKVSIIIPMPNTHQEDNASLLYEREAAVVLHQNLLTAEGLAMLIRRLLFDFNLQKHLRENIKNIMPRGNAAEKIIKLLELS